jgi:hypothetical protein
VSKEDFNPYLCDISYLTEMRRYEKKFFGPSVEHLERTRLKEGACEADLIFSRFEEFVEKYSRNEAYFNRFGRRFIAPQPT